MSSLATQAVKAEMGTAEGEKGVRRCAISHMPTDPLGESDHVIPWSRLGPAHDPPGRAVDGRNFYRTFLRLAIWVQRRVLGGA
jgi:hypothetical protein